MSFDKTIEPFADGTKIRIPGHELVLPELAFGALRALEDDIRKLRDASTPEEEKLSIMYSVVEAALKRHYPEVTRDDVVTAFSLRNLKEGLAGALRFEDEKSGEK